MLFPFFLKKFAATCKFERLLVSGKNPVQWTLSSLWVILYPAQPLVKLNQWNQFSHTDSLGGFHSSPLHHHIGFLCGFFFNAPWGNSINSVSLLLLVNEWHYQDSFHRPRQARCVHRFLDSQVNKRITAHFNKWPYMICVINSVTAPEINLSWPYWLGHSKIMRLHWRQNNALGRGWEICSFLLLFPTKQSSSNWILA